MSETPNPTASHFRPGFGTLTPYLIVKGAEGVVEFAKQAFDAEEIHCTRGPKGEIMNIALRIGTSTLEVSEARGEWSPRPGSLHVYLPDADLAYRRALEAGASSLFEPADMPYGERSGGVVDSGGNHWYLATFTGEVSEDS